MKLGADAPWLEGVEATVTTKDGKAILWQCFIAHMHDTVSWADFMGDEILSLEAAFSAGKRTTELTLNDDVWTIDFLAMEQTNSKTGTIRPIRRIVVLKSGVVKG